VAKGPNAFRTISEAADVLGVPQHVLRFWETRFSFIRPMKRAGGRRFYRPQDVAVLTGVRALLHGSGLSIKDVQALHREQGLSAVVAAGLGPAEAASADMAALGLKVGPKIDPAQRARLIVSMGELTASKDRLDLLLGHPQS
jgi:DNA-binding transcriptional MerR regulator